MRKLLAPLFVASALIAVTTIAPLLDSAKAATNPTPPGQAAPGPGPAPTPFFSFANNASVGNEVDTQANQYYQHYGPVDQAKPLNFADQPKAVPHSYAAGQLYNVQVFKGYSYPQLLGQMAYFTQALGVQCQYCHNLNNYAYDTPTKRIARTMLIMASGVNHVWIDGVKRDYPNYAVSGAVGCATCHRGNPIVSVNWNIVPVQFLDYRYKTTKQAGYVVNSMYAVARSLGTNCLHCHNTADFITLRYYPTNQIAHRMWAMVDEINHKYLPPNVAAVTCYTCHRGNNWPTAVVKAGLDETPVQAIAAHPEAHENPGAHLASGATP
jgi:hypothetical protein